MKIQVTFFTLSADRMIVMSQGGWSHGSPSTWTGTELSVFIRIWI